MIPKGLSKRLAPNRQDATTAQIWPTTWQARTDDGVWVSTSGEMWLYRALPLAPMLWEDRNTRLQVSSPLENILRELAATSTTRGTGLSSLTKSREIHLMAITWEAPAQVPPGTPGRLGDFLGPVLDFSAPSKMLVLGVKLWSKVLSDGAGLRKSLSSLVDRVVLDGGPDFAAYEADKAVVAKICSNNGARNAPSEKARNQLESWFNHGRGPHVEMFEYRDTIVVDGTDRIELAAVQEFETEVFHAPRAPWAMSAQTHPSPASVISVRGQLDPPEIGRSRVRQSQRKLEAAVDEEARTGDLDRPELSAALGLAEQIERHIVSGREPLISDCSILFARRVASGVTESYIDELREVYGMRVIPLPHRQMDALEEMMPGSLKRVNPFPQDVTIPMLAHAGLQGYSNLGDSAGVFVGLVDPDGAMCWLNPRGAPAADKPALTLIAGRSGSGKSFLATILAIQSALGGEQVVFINPKGNDSLAGMTNITGGRVVKLTEIEEEGGFFDPFSFCSDPQIAAGIAQNHILTVLGSRGADRGFDDEQELAVINGLREAAAANVRCVGEALPYIAKYSPVAVKYIQQQASDPLFRLGIATTPRPRLEADKSLILVEFDRELPFPQKSDPSTYLRQERLAVAAVQLVTRAASEMLARAGGGVLVVDEAWVFMKSHEGSAALESLGRLGRSQNILPILITQLVRDFVDSGLDLEEHISRVFCMALANPKEAEAALRLCGLDPTPERIAFLAAAGPVRPEPGVPGRPAMALHRDLKNRHAAVMIGPWPDWIREEISTNPEDRARRAMRQGPSLQPSAPVSSAPQSPAAAPAPAPPTAQMPAPPPAAPPSAPPSPPPAAPQWGVPSSPPPAPPST